MADKIIILPVCSVSAGGCGIEAPAADNCNAKAEVDKKRRQIILSVSNPPAANPKGEITVRIPSSEYNPYECVQKEDCLTIERPVALRHVISNDPIRMEEFPIVKIGEPKHCHWKTTVVTADQADIRSVLFTKIYPIETSECTVIASDESYSADCEGFRNISSLQVMDNSVLVPGMMLNALHHFASGGNEKTYICGKKYYRTCSMTGGVISSVLNNYNLPGIAYMVIVEGYEVYAVPSDFVNYEVGDWVFVMSSSDQCSLDCDINTIPTETEYPGQEEKLNTVGEIGKFVNMLNRLRSNRNLPALTRNTKLTEAAEKHAKDMAENNFYGHTGTDGSDPNDRIEKTGYPGDNRTWGSGENIWKAKGNTATAQNAYNAWIASQGHLGNMLDTAFTEIGIYISEANDGMLYWVNTFGYTAEKTETTEKAEPMNAEFVILPFRIGGQGA